MEKLSLNSVPAAMLYEVKRNKGSYKILSLKCEKSADGFAYLPISGSQFSRSVDEEENPISGYYDILLGTEDLARRLIIKNSNGEFEFTDTTVGEVVSLYEKTDKPAAVSRGIDAAAFFRF